MTTPTAAPLLEARGMTKRYGDFALSEVSFTVEPGQIVGFIGQNGAGKSTSIKALLGLIQLDAGSARVLGTPSGELVKSTGAQLNEQIGVVFDTVALPGHLAVREVAKLMAHAYRTWDMHEFERMTSAFKLDATKAVKDLSRGMGMKLSLACALSHAPRVLILDEATAGLDPLARDEVLDILRQFVAVEDAQGVPQHAILMSSHITSDLEKIADQVICIDDGHIVFTCAKDEITDTMGIARCRVSELDVLAERGALNESGNAEPLRILRHEYGVDVLVSDRFAFAQAHPAIPCDRMTIDDYMGFMLKGTDLQNGGER